MLITEKVIRKFNPCADGIDNFVEHYPKWKGKLSKLLALENVPYDNKIWLVCKIAPDHILKQWSVECAENVIDIFESIRPNDMRVRDCIEGTKKYLSGEITLDELTTLRNAAYYAGAYAAADAAYAAADAAYYAYYAADAAYAAADADAAYYAYYAAAAAAYAADYVARDSQETINLSLLIALLDNEGL